MFLEVLKNPQYIPQYLSSQAFLFLAQALPLEMALRLGEWGGKHMMLWTPGRVDLVIDNLRRALPELSHEQAQRLAVRVYRHFGRAAVEMAVAPRLMRPSNWRQHVTVRNEHYMRQVLDEGKGAIFVTGHVGVWEVFGLLLTHWGAAPASVYRPIKNPLIDRLVRQRRRAFGQQIVEREGALPILLRVLRRRGYIALLIDQHAKRDGVWVPFFGRPASTTPAAALLALRTGVPIITGYGRRLPGLFQFEVFVDEPIYAKPTGDRAGDVVRLTAELSRRIETYVRETPDQWLWMHKRWRTPPAPIEDR